MYWDSLVYHYKLHRIHRCEDPVLQEKLNALRHGIPDEGMLKKLCRNHKAWESPGEPTDAEVRRLFREKAPNTTVVTCTKKGARAIGEQAVQAIHGRQQKLAELPGDYEVNPDNYDNKGKLIKEMPEPSTVPIYRGMRLHLTRNMAKARDFVNGMEATVRAFHATSGCLTVRTATGKLLAMYPYTDRETRATFYPVRIGYAGIIYKIQGHTLDHVTVWLDREGSRAAGYVALSRVRKDRDYLLGGDMQPQHVVPANYT